MSINKNKKVKNTVSKTETTQTNWVDHTKTFASKNNMSFGESLSNVNNRAQFYDTMIDRDKFNRGPNLLQPDHPAMHPFIPNLSPQEKKMKDEIYIQTKRNMCGKTPTFNNK